MMVSPSGNPGTGLFPFQVLFQLSVDPALVLRHGRLGDQAYRPDPPSELLHIALDHARLHATRVKGRLVRGGCQSVRGAS